MYKFSPLPQTKGKGGERMVRKDQSQPSRTHALHGEGATRERDDQLAQTKEPLGTAFEEEQKKKRFGENRPST